MRPGSQPQQRSGLSAEESTRLVSHGSDRFQTIPFKIWRADRNRVSSIRGLFVGVWATAATAWRMPPPSPSWHRPRCTSKALSSCSKPNNMAVVSDGFVAPLLDVVDDQQHDGHEAPTVTTRGSALRLSSKAGFIDRCAAQRRGILGPYRPTIRLIGRESPLPRPLKFRPLSEWCRSTAGLPQCVKRRVALFEPGRRNDRLDVSQPLLEIL